MLVAALAGGIWWLLLPTGALLAPLWTQVVGWPLAVVVRAEPVQRLLGGGRLENRVWLRPLVGSVIFALIIAPTGMSFLFPLFATLVASVHLHWSGSRAWRAGVVLTVLMTLLVQVGVHLGVWASAVPLALSDVATVTAVVASLSTTVNIALLAARREEVASALAAERAAGEVQRRARHAELVHAATHDALTGQLNRAGMRQRLEQALRRAAPGAGAGVVFIDLDGFKPVNDRYGHAAGDHLLQLAAQRLAAVVRPDDGVARVGGDEFVAVLPAVSAPQVLAAVAARADAALRAPFDPQGTVVRISASTGTALTYRAGVSVDELLHQADTTMYAVKTGRQDRRQDR
ncbi:diguanylate cyclase domain-containing protein [Kineococcus sp. SYSU DK005]|uniref:diguanylate cyclase domain-containing protein n=1 Tax=Kineococcus sp. SYSU DK005 TaxID=3383126 RepID=UPI003D7D3DE3